MNASYNLIHNIVGVDSNSIAQAFIEFLKIKKINFINKQYLKAGQWENNRFLFCIGITPITCFNLHGWEGQKNWTLITFSSFPQKAKNWGIELSKSLKTKIECHDVYDTSSIYNVHRFENERYLLYTIDFNSIPKKSLAEIKGEVKKSLKEKFINDCGSVESYVAQDYYSLKTFNRVNNIGEQFLVFQNNKETYYKNPSKKNIKKVKQSDLEF